MRDFEVGVPTLNHNGKNDKIYMHLSVVIKKIKVCPSCAFEREMKVLLKLPVGNKSIVSTLKISFRLEESNWMAKTLKLD